MWAFGIHKIKEFVISTLPAHKNNEVDETSFGLIKGLAECSGCEASMKLVQSLFRSHFVHSFVNGVGNDLCWLGKGKIAHSSCSLFVKQAVPTIMD